MRIRFAVCVALFAVPLALTAPVPKTPSTDWLAFGGGPGRKMVNPNAGSIPSDFKPEAGKHILWTADLGTRSYTQPVVAGGRVFVGTNNERPRNRRDTKRANGEVEPIDKGAVYCFSTKGEFRWQAVHDQLPGGGVNPWPREGIPSTPTVDGTRLYYLNNRAEVVCADVNGFADGDQGDKDDRLDHPTDGDIIWRVDLVKRYGVRPHCLPASSPLVVEDTVFVVTSHGIDEAHRQVDNPDAPSLVALNKKTGELIWSDNSPGKNIQHGQWSSPAYTDRPVPQVVSGGGDGWLRGFDPKTGQLLWKFDGNPKAAKKGDRNDFLATPVIHDGKLYVGTGQDPEHFTGSADLWCVDLAKAVEFGKTNPDHDVSPVADCFDPADPRNAKSALAWHFGGKNTKAFPLRNYKFGRTQSTACVADGVLYVAELRGFLHCFDATTGKRHWMYDVRGSVWGSPFVADGKVFLGTEAGDLFVFKHDPKPFALDPDAERAKGANGGDANRRFREAMKQVEQKVLIRKVEFPHSIRSTPTAVNGVLYVATEEKLYAIGAKKE
jgi:outer membrane protein assembly factor BamB